VSATSPSARRKPLTAEDGEAIAQQAPAVEADGARIDTKHWLLRLRL